MSLAIHEFAVTSFLEDEEGNILLEYIKLRNLPEYWKMQIRKFKCPYCGPTLYKVEEPIEHYHCRKCGRDYA